MSAGWIAIDRFMKNEVWQEIEETLQEWRKQARDVMCDTDEDVVWRHGQGIVATIDRVLFLPETMLETAKSAVEENNDGEA